MNIGFTKRTKSPFRFDTVGSFLRPEKLKQARADFSAGKISADRLKEVEDEAIRDLVAKQKQAGLKAVTDGEFRRATWHLDFMWGFHGVGHHPTKTGLPFHDEAAMIDGCNAWQRVRYITLPLSKNSFKVYAILCITGCIKQFDMIWAMTGGGPNATSSTPAILLYLNAYSFKLMGRSAAIAVILLILGVGLSVLCNKVFRQEEY